MIGATGKLLWIWHELYADGTLRATEEILGLHVAGIAAGRRPFPDDVHDALQRALTEPPEHASRSIRSVEREPRPLSTTEWPPRVQRRRPRPRGRPTSTPTTAPGPRRRALSEDACTATTRAPIGWCSSGPSDVRLRQSRLELRS